MSRPRAPTARRIPISRVLSVTDTSMMFMIPIPPTRRDTAATLASRAPSVREVAVAAATISSWLRTVKSSSSGFPILWRWRRSPVTSSSAAWRADPSRATAMMDVSRFFL